VRFERRRPARDQTGRDPGQRPSGDREFRVCGGGWRQVCFSATWQEAAVFGGIRGLARSGAAEFRRLRKLSARSGCRARAGSVVWLLASVDARSDGRVVRHQPAGSSGQRAWHSGVECSLKTEETDEKRVRVTFWIARSETASVNFKPGPHRSR